MKKIENVKEFVWKYLNDESTSNFEIIEVPKIDKLESVAITYLFMIHCPFCFLLLYHRNKQ